MANVKVINIPVVYNFANLVVYPASQEVYIIPNSIVINFLYCRVEAASIFSVFLLPHQNYPWKEFKSNYWQTMCTACFRASVLMWDLPNCIQAYLSLLKIFLSAGFWER
jgi:hypothetical protein